jgi:hypothetical protein
VSDQINLVSAAWQVWRGTHARRPDPAGSGSFDHRGFAPILDALAAGGIGGLAGLQTELDGYRRALSGVDPDQLSPDQALAFWINLYNAEALALTATAEESGLNTVLRSPGAFSKARTTIAGEALSLNQIEHGKIRRFRDPRIHSTLVCGTVSCPTLRFEPFDGSKVDGQLDDQMKVFLANGGAVPDTDRGTLSLSRVLQWYGADFVRPHAMPGWIPPRKTHLVEAINPWLDAAVTDWLADAGPKISFQRYDWGLGCSVR